MRNGIEQQIGELLALGPREAAEKLKAGEIAPGWGDGVCRHCLVGNTHICPAAPPRSVMNSRRLRRYQLMGEFQE